MALKVDGKVLDLDAPRSILLRIKSFLDKAPKDELFTSGRLWELKVAGKNAIQEFAADQNFKAYSFNRPGKSTHFGHPAAIAEFKKLIGAKFAGEK